MRRWLRRLGLTLVGLSGLVALVAGGAFLWWSRGGLPQRSGTARIAGLSAPVQVRFDDFGVPHVDARNVVDLAAALGWLHANDRMFQLEMGRRAASGRLSEVVPDFSAYFLDQRALQLRLRASAERTWDALGEESRAVLEGYARGVNAWLAQRGGDLPPDLRLLRLRPEPWGPVDSLCFHFLMARDLSYVRTFEERRFEWLVSQGEERTREITGLDFELAAELAAIVAAEAAREPPDSGAAASSAASELPGRGGSNSWAVGASRSASGHPLVAGDPHLSLALPAVWYQATLRAPDYEAAGMSLVGLPLVVIGQTPHLAWAFTNGELDLNDSFVERLSEDGSAVLRGDEWVPIAVETVTLPLAGGETAEVEVRSTDIGPFYGASNLDMNTAGQVPDTPEARRRLLESAARMPPRSLAWNAYEPFDPLRAFLELARARDLAGVDRAIADFVAPVQNIVVGTRDGELLLTLLGRVPVRGAGDGRTFAPAWRPEYRWRGAQPHDEKPRVAGPADDLLVSANNDIRPPGYERPLAGDFSTDHRARRIRALLLERDTWTPAEMAAIQTDVVSLYAREVIAHLQRPLPGASPAAEEARARLAAWDGSMDLGEVPALFAVFDERLKGEVEQQLMAPSRVSPPALSYPSRRPAILAWLARAGPERDAGLIRALARALDEHTRAGRPTYAELHTWTPTHPMGVVPYLGSFFDRGPFAVPGSATTVGVFADSHHVSHGASMRLIADTGDPDRSLAVLPMGQSGHPFDRHYDDQLPLYLAGELRPVRWSEAAIAEAAVSSLTLAP